MTTWVVVADSSRARIFESRRHGRELVEMEVLLHPESRQKISEIMSDSEGTQTDRGGFGQRKSDPRTPPDTVESNKFAREIAQYLNKHRTNNDYDELVFTAPPEFLGQLRASCDNQVQKLITRTVVKDYTQLTCNELLEHLEGKLH